MSIARLCDICGKTMKGDMGEKEFFDLSVMKGDEPLLEGEDICHECMANFEATLKNFVKAGGETLVRPQLTVKATVLNEHGKDADSTKRQPKIELPKPQPQKPRRGEEQFEMRHSTDEEREAYEDMLEGMSVPVDVDIDKLMDEVREVEELDVQPARAEKVEPPKPKTELREGVVKSTVFKMPETRGRAQGSLID